MLGKAEQKRFGVIELKHPAGANETAAAAEDEWKRPKLWWFNLLLTLSLIGSQYQEK